MIDSVIKEWGGTEVDAMTVYSDMFKLGQGYIQRSNEEPGQYKANPLVYWKNDEDRMVYALHNLKDPRSPRRKIRPYVPLQMQI